MDVQAVNCLIKQFCNNAKGERYAQDFGNLSWRAEGCCEELPLRHLRSGQTLLIFPHKSGAGKQTIFQSRFVFNQFSVSSRVTHSKGAKGAGAEVRRRLLDTLQV
jgi:hypothetical protein